MKDPARLLETSASELEQRLLRAGLAEQPPSAAMQRLAETLGVRVDAGHVGHVGKDALASASKLQLLAANKGILVALGLATAAVLTLFVGIGTRATTPPGSSEALAAPTSEASASSPSAAVRTSQTGDAPSVHARDEYAAERGTSERSNDPSDSAHAASPRARDAAERVVAGDTGDNARAASDSRPARAARTHGSAPSRHGVHAIKPASEIGARAARHAPQAAALGSNREAGSPSDTPKDEPRSSAEASAVQGQENTLDARSLAQEIAQIDSVRRQLAAQRAKPAIAALREYQREFPRGVLRQEAEVLNIEAHQQAGDRGSARKRAERFLAKSPDSPHSARVRDLLEALGSDAR